MFDWNKKGLIEEVKELIAKVENSNEDIKKWLKEVDKSDIFGKQSEGGEKKEPKKLDQKTSGSIYKGKTWKEIFEKRLNPTETKSWWIEKVYKSEESLFSDDVFSHYQLKSEEGNYKTKIPSELNEYIEEKFDTSESRIYNSKKQNTTKGGEGKKEEQVNIEGKSKDINKLVNFIKGKTGINLSEYKGYAEDKGWSKRNQLYIDYDKLRKDWFRKDNAKYEDTLYWLGLYSDTEDNGGFGKFVTPKKDKKIDNSLTNTIAEALVEVIAENCCE